jgi:putative MATE family efflux protein
MSQKTIIKQLEIKPIGPLLLSYSIPAIVSMVIVSLYNIISSIFIGHGVGHLGITGLAVTFPFMNLVLAVCMLVAIGGATLCSIELGAKNPARAAQILGHNVMLSILFAVVFTAVSLLFLDPILIAFGASEDTLPYAHAYMEIILWGGPIASLMIALSHFLRASGYPAKSMLISLLSVGANIVLTAIFIFTLDWGIRGAAAATVLSQAIALAFLIKHFRNPGSEVHFQPGIFTLRQAVVKDMLSIGLSPFLMNLCACLIIVVINLSLYKYGGDLAIGAYGIANRLLMLFAMTIMGLTQGMQPLIGYNYGARRMDRVHRTLYLGIAAATLVTTLGCLAAQLFPSSLARLFTDHEELIEISVNGLRLCTAMFFLVGSQIVIAGYFQSMGRASIAIFMSLSRQLLFLLPGLLLLPRYFGLDGVWMSLPLADAIAAVINILILCYTLKNPPVRYTKQV